MTDRASAEPVAATVADIRAGRAQHRIGDPRINRVALDRAQQPQPVVDVTALYWDLHRRVIGDGKGVMLYEDHPSIAPPWDNALVSYINDSGNVIILQAHAQPWSTDRQWETDNPVDWFRVRWLIETFVWLGGRDKTGAAMPTTGPVHLFQHAVYADGSPADIHWVQLLPGPSRTDIWEMPLLTLAATLNFLNCSNVELAEPQRPRPERRRLAHTGVTVQAIVVRPIGKRTRSGGGVRPTDADDTPLTNVRGHFAHYGATYGKGRLFGKYEGKFWIPGYARGAAGEDTTTQKDYVLKPTEAAR